MPITIKNGQVISITMEIWGIIFGFIAYCMIISYKNSDSISWKTDKVWRWAIFVYGLALLSDIMCNAFDGDPSTLGYYVQRIANFFEYFLNYVLSLSFCGICMNAIDEPEVGKKWMKVFQMIVAVYFVLLLVNEFTHWFYYFDEQNYYHRGYLFPLSQLLAIVIQVIELSLIIRYRNKIRKTMYFSFLMFIILPGFAMLGMLFVYGIALIYWAITISMIIMFLAMQMDVASALQAQEKQLAQNKIQSMLSQLHPHFLYNALMAIMAIQGNPPETKKAISNFGKYLRCNLDSLDNFSMIPFLKEFHHIETYVNLEKLRFEDELEVIYDIQEKNFDVPALSVQMMVENAIKHGVTKKKGKGTVKLSTRREDAEYIITIEDDGVGFDPEVMPEDGRVHVGIVNTKERIRLLADGNLYIHSEAGIGTRIEIRLPVIDEVL